MKKRFSWFCAAFLSAALLVPSFASAEQFSIRNGLTFGMTAQEIQEKEPDMTALGDSASFFTKLNGHNAVFLVQFNQDVDCGGVSTIYSYLVYSGQNDDDAAMNVFNEKIKDALIQKYGQVSVFSDSPEEEKEQILNKLTENGYQIYQEDTTFSSVIDECQVWKTNDAFVVFSKESSEKDMMIYYVSLNDYDTAPNTDLSSVL